MGSLNFDGSIKTQSLNKLTVRHQGNFLTKADAPSDTVSSIVSNSGFIDRKNTVIVGVAWQQGTQPEGASTSGLPGTPGTMSKAFADNTQERKKHTANSEEAGNLQHYATRKIDGIHTSVSDRQAIADYEAAVGSGLAGGDAIGPMQTISERKVFFVDGDRGKTSGLGAWTIFDASGAAVGADDGTTDVDITANEGLLDKPLD